MGWRERDAGEEAARQGSGVYMNPHDGRSNDYEERRKERDWEDGHRSEKIRQEERAREEEEAQQEKLRLIYLDAERRREEEEREEEEYEDELPEEDE